MIYRLSFFPGRTRAASSGEAPKQKHYPQDSDACDAVGGDLCVDDPGRGSHDWLAGRPPLHGMLPAPGVEPGEQLVHAWSTGPSHMVFRGAGRCHRIPARFGRRILILHLIGAYAWFRLYEDRERGAKSRFLWVVD